MKQDKLQAILLGVAQDAGVPQVGCLCKNCNLARKDNGKRHLVTCVGIVDRTVGKSWLMDCTPDFRQQIDILTKFAPDCNLAGILITHAHIGHYLGLAHLGKEAMDAQLMPVYVSDRMGQFLESNAPWDQLVERQNIDIVRIESGISVDFSAGISIEAVLVPHRQDYTDTFAFVVRGSNNNLFYCPDIDDWDDWHHDLKEFVDEVDIALLDGTFCDEDELSGRDMNEVSHPIVMNTIERLGDTHCDVRLVHLNHTNILFAKDCEYRMLRKYGVKVGNTGDLWSL